MPYKHHDGVRFPGGLLEWRIVAQLVERGPDKAEVGGPNPPGPTEEWPSGRWRRSRKPQVERLVGPNPTSSSGKVAEWSKAPSCYLGRRKPRGSESRPFREMERAKKESQP